MESFIVRIYRRPRARAAEVSGTVEWIGSGRRQGFSGREELLDLLTGGAPATDEEIVSSPRSRRASRGAR